jgi:transcriptional regulator with XRE-family HTH domain
MDTSKTFARPTIRVNRRYTEALIALMGVSKTAVARRAGVGNATVSKVLRNRRDVAPEKRRAVLHAISELCHADPDELVLGKAA